MEMETLVGKVKGREGEEGRGGETSVSHVDIIGWDTQDTRLG